MIRFARPEEKEELYQMWKETFTFDDGGFIDYFFEERYEEGRHFVLYEDEIVSCASVFSHNYRIHDRNLRVSMISGVITKEKYRHQGKMHELLKEVIDQLSHQELMTMIQAYHPEIYRDLGFEVAYHRMCYHIEKSSFKSYCFGKIKESFQEEELLRCYGYFTKRFHGFKLRSEEDFKHYRTQIQREGGKMIAYEEERIKGYAVYFEKEDTIVVEEIIYEDLRALVSILTYLFRFKEKLNVYTSEKEALHRFIPVVSYEKIEDTLVRINDYEMFNRLFQSDVKNVKEALSLYRKPLFMKEDY